MEMSTPDLGDDGKDGVSRLMIVGAVSGSALLLCVAAIAVRAKRRGAAGVLSMLTCGLAGMRDCGSPYSGCWVEFMDNPGHSPQPVLVFPGKKGEPVPIRLLERVDGTGEGTEGGSGNDDETWGGSGNLDVVLIGVLPDGTRLAIGQDWGIIGEVEGQHGDYGDDGWEEVGEESIGASTFQRLFAEVRSCRERSCLRSDIQSNAS